MNNLASYLERFRSLIGDKAEEKRVFQEAVSLYCNFSLPFDSIAIKNTVVALSTTPLERTEIFMHKKEILQYCSDHSAKITDLR